MEASDNTEHWSGRPGFIVAVLAGIAWGIYRFGDRFGLDSPRAKIYVFLAYVLPFFCSAMGGKSSSISETEITRRKSLPHRKKQLRPSRNLPIPILCPILSRRFVTSMVVAGGVKSHF